MTRRLLSKILLLALCLAWTTASAQVSVVYKHDQFAESVQTAATEASGIPLATQPGFVKGEAFGQVYHPAENAYPINFTAVDIIVAAPPNLPDGSAHATIEFYYHEGNGPDPGKVTPDFTLSTYDVFDPMSGELGMPLQGNTAMTFEFDSEDPEGHPPTLNSGNFTVAVRFLSQASDMQAEWGSFQCSAMPDLGMCGCQGVGTLHDQATTNQANVMHIIYPPGNCNGNANKWVFAEDIGVTGDFIIRARATAAAGTCTPDCTGKECGDDGCGGSCGQCAGGTICQAGECVESTCTPDCTGKECGDDGCGGDCGLCEEGESCSNGQCTTGGCQPACDGKDCGDDGCGGVCGLCEEGAVCVQGTCQGSCAPACSGKECGDDGCGGVCGLCAADEACVQGLCQAGTGEGDTLQVTAISPDFGFNDEETEVSIVGKGFQPGATVMLGASYLGAVQVISGDLISAIVPQGLQPGKYMLIVKNSDNATASLPDAFSVQAPPPGAADSGCTTGNGTGLAPVMLLLALALLLCVWRRRSHS